MDAAQWLWTTLPPTAQPWLRSTADQFQSLSLSDPAAQRQLAIAFAQISRHCPRTTLETAAPTDLLPGWNPQQWNHQQAARVWFLTQLPTPTNSAVFVHALDELFARADLHESIAIYSSLPILTAGSALTARAAEGIRSNIPAVFAAVAFDSPFPAARFDEDAWNQMVLKCFFLAEPSHRIVGFDRRCNPALARMLSQYAHERWAAGRTVPHGLWRGIAPHATDAHIEDFRRALATEDTQQHQAVLLALTHCPHPAAAELRAQFPAIGAQ